MTAGSTFRLPAQCLGCSHLNTESADICKSEGLSDLWGQLRADRGAPAGYSPPGAPKTVLTGAASPRPAFPSLVCKVKRLRKEGTEHVAGDSRSSQTSALFRPKGCRQSCAPQSNRKEPGRWLENPHPNSWLLLSAQGRLCSHS